MVARRAARRPEAHRAARGRGAPAHPIGVRCAATAMLDLDAHREGPPARDASTLVVVRDAQRRRPSRCSASSGRRSASSAGRSSFRAASSTRRDLDPEWERWSHRAARRRRRPSRPTRRRCAGSRSPRAARRSRRPPSCRSSGAAPAHAELLDWRGQLARGARDAAAAARVARAAVSTSRRCTRWRAGSRRSPNPAASTRASSSSWPTARRPGAHDDHETTASFWATPADVLDRHASKALQLAPPTHRTLEVLARRTRRRRSGGHRRRRVPRADLPAPGHAARRRAARRWPSSCRAIPSTTCAKCASPGPSRYVLRDGRFWPEDAPARR